MTCRSTRPPKLSSATFGVFRSFGNFGSFGSLGSSGFGVVRVNAQPSTRGLGSKKNSVTARKEGPSRSAGSAGTTGRLLRLGTDFELFWMV